MRFSHPTNIPGIRAYKVLFFKTFTSRQYLTNTKIILHLQGKSTKGFDMPKKLSNEKLIAKQEKEEYLLQVQDLLDMIPSSTVFCKDETFRYKEVVIPSNKWFIGSDYVLNSDYYKLCTLDAEDKEVPMWYLTKTDYAKIVHACKKRHAELLKQHNIKSK